MDWVIHDSTNTPTACHAEACGLGVRCHAQRYVMTADPTETGASGKFVMMAGAKSGGDLFK
jgi:hypothetical protein